MTAHSRNLPSFTERTSYGIVESTPYNKLFEGRIVFLGTPIDDACANDVTAQLICLESSEPDRPIELYINSPGGSITAMAAIYDTMQYIRPPVHTYCLGQAASAAAVLLAAGTAGHRGVVPSARCLLHQPSTAGFHGPESDLAIQAAEVTRMRAFLESTLALHTGRPVAQVHADVERDLFLDAEQSVAYGLADVIIPSRKLRSLP